MRYVRMWYIIRHTKTKIIARVHTAHGTRADFFFGMYQLETRFARIKNGGILLTFCIPGTCLRKVKFALRCRSVGFTVPKLESFRGALRTAM